MRRVNRLHGGSPPTHGVIFGKRNGSTYARNYNFGLNDTLKAADILPQERGPYGFRHGFRTALANGFYGEGWTLKRAQKLMRHKSPRTTEVYYHVLNSTLAEEASRAVALSNEKFFERTNPAEHKRKEKPISFVCHMTSHR